MVRTRFAPSPTGIPHVGNIRTALFCYFFTRANNGVFILRIEDTDQARKVDGAVEKIQESLRWLGIKWDEYIVQSEHLSDYKKYAEELVQKGIAKHEDGAIRFLVPKDGTTSWVDKVGNKKIEFKNNEVEDFIILKKDGFPTYHLANVIDDHKERITHVIRGEDWVPSTPKHILLYKAFEWELPEFVHVPNVLATDGKKLSKRKGAKSVLDFKEEGFLSEALLNYLALLGWSPKNDKEILTEDQIISEFSLEKINISPAIFDLVKLEWMNGAYLREKLSLGELKSRILDFYKNDKEVSSFVRSTKNLDTIIELAKTRMKTLKDFKDLVLEPKEEFKFSSEQKEQIKELINHLKKVSDWEKDEILNSLKDFKEKSGASFKTIYFFITGKEKGLPMAETMEIFGKEKVLEDLKKRIK